MKKFLPLLPAFLLCFAGGLHLLPARSDTASCVLASCVLDADLPGDAASYEKWVAAQNGIKETLKSLENSKVADLAKKAEQTRADVLIEAIGVDAKKYKSSLEQSEWCTKAQNQLASSKLKPVSEKLRGLVATINQGSGEVFETRKQTYLEFRDLSGKYDTLVPAEIDTMKKWFEKNRPPAQ